MARAHAPRQALNPENDGWVRGLRPPPPSPALPATSAKLTRQLEARAKKQRREAAACGATSAYARHQAADLSLGPATQRSLGHRVNLSTGHTTAAAAGRQFASVSAEQQVATLPGRALQPPRPRAAGVAALTPRRPARSAAAR
jgi:hypothetical protein